MATVESKAAEAAAQATAAAEVKKPQPLTGWEKLVAGLLFVGGLALIGVTLYAFSSTNSNFTFKAKAKIAKETTAGTSGGGSEPQAGESEGNKTPTGEQGGTQQAQTTPVTKETSEIEYADTVVIFALTIGAALSLAGGFYARLRSLKLGALELGFVSEDDKKAATESAAKKVEAKVTDPTKQDAAKAAAQQVAIADLTKAVALGVQPTQSMIEGIADQAAEKVTEAVK